MIVEVICNHITSLDPQRLSSQSAYLRMCVDMTTEQASEMLDALLEHKGLTDSIVRECLKDKRPDLIESIEENAVSNAGEAYCEQRDRMATS
jgi:hypothetical protein